MEKVNEVIKENSKDQSNFFSYVFNFDEENKAGILNMLQYTLLAIIPVIVMLKLIKHYIPEDDDSKPTLEILVEIIVQLIIIFICIWFIDKMIRFIPTYSGFNYFKFNETNFIIPILIVLITMQTKLCAKINIIVEQISDLWNGNSSNNVKGNSQVKVTQPISRNTPYHMPSQADTFNQAMAPPLNIQNNINPGNTTLINDLPMNGNNQQMNNPNMNEILDPSPLMAANEALGGAFGSAF